MIENSPPHNETGKRKSPIFSKYNIDIETVDLFLNSFCIDLKNRAVFSYTKENKEVNTELVGLNTHKKCVSEGLWKFGEESFPSDIFLFCSALEAMVFVHLNKYKNLVYRSLFISLGIKPRKEQIIEIKRNYARSNPNYHAVFDNDPISRVLDCKVSLWLVNKDCSFYFFGNSISIISNTSTGQKRIVKISNKIFCYWIFCRKFGKKVNLRIHKPPKSFISFLDMLKDNH